MGLCLVSKQTLPDSHHASITCREVHSTDRFETAISFRRFGLLASNGNERNLKALTSRLATNQAGGPAESTSWDTPSAYFVKLSRNRPASLAAVVS